VTQRRLGSFDNVVDMRLLDAALRTRLAFLFIFFFFCFAARLRARGTRGAARLLLTPRTTDGWLAVGR